MKKISESDLKELELQNLQLEEDVSELQNRVDLFNQRVAELYSELVEPQVEEVNGALTGLQTVVTRIHDDMQEYFYDQSEDWQDSDDGQAYQDWMEQYAEMEGGLDSIEMEEICELTMPEVEVPEFQLEP